MREYSVPQSDFAGVGIRRDSTRAVGYARKAFASRNVHAAYFLGLAHARGQGCKADTALSARYLRYAADTALLPAAQLALADFAFNARYGYKLDLRQAKYYYALAAKNPRATPEEQATGEIGLHTLGKFRRRIYNLQLMLVLPDPDTAPRLLIPQ
jgi:TPR repeat protein